MTTILEAMVEAYDEGYYQARLDGHEEDASSKRAMAAACRVAAEMLEVEQSRAQVWECLREIAEQAND